MYISITFLQHCEIMIGYYIVTNNIIFPEVFEMKRNLITFLLATVLTATTIVPVQSAFAQNKSEASSENMTNLSKDTALVGRVSEYKLESGNQTFVYVPQGENIDVGHNATWKPIILVYSDILLNESNVEQYAKDNGFADIAAKEQCVIMFVNPLNDSGWTKDDKESLLAAVGSNDFENAAYSDGTLLDYDSSNGLNENGKLPGYTERVYVFANGSGADFVSEYILCGKDDTVHYMEGFYKPAAAFLSNVNNIPKEIYTKLESTEMPVYLVNASSDVETFYSEINTDGHFMSVHAEKKDGFDAANVTAAWDSIISNVRRCYDVVIDIPDYETNFVCENEIFTASTGAVLEYYLFTPNVLAEQDENSVPIVIGMHGNDNSALTMANITEWPTLAEENGFIYMGLNHCEAMTDDEIMEAIQNVIQNHPIIDTSRVYMTGFSNGAIHTWNMISNEKYKNFFAAVAPMNACTTRDDYRGDEETVGKMATGSIMPVIYFGATGSHILEMPNQPWSIMSIGVPEDTLTYIFERNNVTSEYTNNTESGFWGLEPNSEEEIISKYYQDENNKLVKNIVSSYESEDGNIYTKLVAVTSIHEYEDVNAETAWEFFSQFSRNEDGSINVADQIVK